MRSCTGWPSGVWIDAPRRTAPDGSNFQLQHWTHTFDFALVSGRGDWRETEMPARAEFNHPMVAVAADGERVLPPDGSLLTVEPAAHAVGRTQRSAATRPPPVAPGLSTLRMSPFGSSKPRRDNGSHDPSSPVRSPGWSRPTCWETARGGGQSPLRLHGYQIATLLAHPTCPRCSTPTGPPLAPDAEAAQPCTPATGCTTAAPFAGRPARRGPPAPGNHDGRTGHTGEGCGCRWPATAATPPERHWWPGAVRPAGRYPARRITVVELPARGHRRRTSR